ncbi:hypothetical protein RJ639_029762 [Escallonia herrerae]|uniref:J domain-containing protein n=1 Tax=Escallonia herrerae TaxID=1293975 RepID=A0AA88X4D7_9ASTE|nr:hypothetical protein RJ639_029762 [Escallonia herrerae]
MPRPKKQSSHRFPFRTQDMISTIGAAKRVHEGDVEDDRIRKRARVSTELSLGSLNYDGPSFLRTKPTREEIRVARQLRWFSLFCPEGGKLRLFEDPWKIKKRLNITDLGRVLLSKEAVDTHVLRHWNAGSIKALPTGVTVNVWDYDSDTEHRLILVRWPYSKYCALGSRNWGQDFVLRRNLREGDEIGLLWDNSARRFGFCVLDQPRTKCQYKVLGLGGDCTADEIHSAYRRLALQRHPDKLAQFGISPAAYRWLALQAYQTSPFP